MRTIHWILTGFSVAAFFVAEAHARDTPGAGGAVCSMELFPSLRDPEATMAVAKAGLDTLPAGPGSIELHRNPRRMKPNRYRIIYGQTFEVSEIAGAFADRVERAFDLQGNRTIVVVPWAFQEGCGPVPWPLSARWVDPGQIGAFVDLALRPRNRWAYGKPTFDAFAAYGKPYPVAPRFKERDSVGDSIATNSLTPQEYLHLYQALPTYNDVGPAYRNALDGFDEWVASYPLAARKYPVAIMRIQTEASVVAISRYRPVTDRFRP